MKNYVEFSDFATPVNLAGLKDVYGVVNGYKIKSVLHGGRRISLAGNTYFYVPRVNLVVTYKANKAKELVISEGKFNFQEKLLPRGHWSFKADASTIFALANEIFG